MSFMYNLDQNDFNLFANYSYTEVVFKYYISGIKNSNKCS